MSGDFGEVAACRTLKIWLLQPFGVFVSPLGKLFLKLLLALDWHFLCPALTTIKRWIRSVALLSLLCCLSLFPFPHLPVLLTTSSCSNSPLSSSWPDSAIRLFHPVAALGSCSSGLVIQLSIVRCLKNKSISKQ